MEILKIIFIVVEVIVLFNLLIIVHEVGHFLAARWRGLVVDRFGIWFGKPIWQKEYKGVKYCLGWIPAGGFVSLPQMAPMEAIEGESSVDVANLPQASVLDRIIVAFAGPLFSFLLALVFACLIWGIGRPVYEVDATRIVGHVGTNSPAAKAGLLPGDEIIAIDGQPVTRFGGIGTDSIKWRIVSSENDTLKLTIRRKGEEKTLEAAPIMEEVWGTYRAATAKDDGTIEYVLKGSPAEKAGLQGGDKVLAVDGQPVARLSGIGDSFASRLSSAKNAKIKITYLRQQKTNVVETAEKPPRSGFGKRSSLRQIMIGPAYTSIIAEILPHSPAEVAGLKAEDVVEKVNGQPIIHPAQIEDLVDAAGTNAMTLEVRRSTNQLTVKITPEVPFQAAAADKKPMLGIFWDSRGVQKLDRPGPLEQVRTSVDMMVSTFGALFSKKSNIKPQHLSGPLGIMRIYYLLFQSEHGWRMALWFSVIFNVNLALLNLLPIPVLDGGHIVLALIEGIRRKAMNIKVLQAVQTGCAVLLIGYMLYITFYDASSLTERGTEPQIPKFAPKAQIQKR